MILVAALILMSVVTPMINIFFRKLNETAADSNESDTETIGNETGTDDQEPEANGTETDTVKESGKDVALAPISIILAVHDNARELERNLPVMLTQDYAAGYEVIVVVDKGEDDTDDVLTRLSNEYNNLYATFVPDSSRYMSKRKLAVTLGVKAAKHEWIMMTEATCKPDSDQWLKTMGRHCTDNNDMVIGYSNYHQEATDFQRFERLLTQRYLLSTARYHTAYRSEPGNLMFRKSLFMNGRGYEGNLKYIRGEYDFLVNKIASKGRTAVVLSPEACLVEDSPAKKQLRNHHLFYMETRKHLRRSFLFRLRFNIDQAAMHLNYLLIISYGVYAALTQNLLVGSAALLALLITVALRTFLARRAINQHGEKIPSWKIIPMEISILWRNGWRKLKYFMTNKNDFISHKI